MPSGNVGGSVSASFAARVVPFTARVSALPARESSAGPESSLNAPGFSLTVSGSPVAVVARGSSAALMLLGSHGGVRGGRVQCLVNRRRQRRSDTRHGLDLLHARPAHGLDRKSVV